MSAADDLLTEATIAMRLHVYEVLETARRKLCCYMGDPCDCKYGRGPDTRPGSEATGCPELRDLIETLTGFSPFNRGQSVEDDMERIGARLRDLAIRGIGPHEQHKSH